MNSLAQRLARLIAAQGPITIAQYMTMALHDREHGYYATRDPLGAAGDFTTAPEISQMFGEMLGLWCVQVWHDQGRPLPVRLVELGPGRGTLMDDALRAMRVAPDLLAALDVVLIEASPALRAVQMKKLANADAPLSWKPHFNEAIADRTLFMLANEFFDALPIRQFVKTESAWHERMVSVSPESELEFALSPVVADALVPADRRDAPKGGVVEAAPGATALAQEISRAVARCGGGALIVDYGYDVSGFGETLQAVESHSFADVLANPGENDLSAHVDFRALRDAVLAGGARPYGPIGQGPFLVDLGITTRAERLAHNNPSAASAVKAALERLIAPAQMGTLFKALAMVPDAAPKPPGFS